VRTKPCARLSHLRRRQPPPRWFWLSCLLALIAISAALSLGAHALYAAAHRPAAPGGNGSTILTSPPPVATATPGSQFNPPSPVAGATSGNVPLPTNRDVVYATGNGIYAIPVAGGNVWQLNTPDYQAQFSPLLTPSGQVLYGGDGLWLSDVFASAATQIATLPPGMTITSAAFSPGGHYLTWNAESTNGQGNDSIYAGPVGSTYPVYEQSAQPCPCFTALGFAPRNPQTPGYWSRLLVTNDLGSPGGPGSGLWVLDPRAGIPSGPILSPAHGQGPLALVDGGQAILYAPTEGVVPQPTDGSVPASEADGPYASSLAIARWNGQEYANPTMLVAPPPDGVSASLYSWIVTPESSPNGATIAYVQFTTDTQVPYDRHNAVYVVPTTGGQPQLVATFTAKLVELGGWINQDLLAVYADGGIWALDVHTGAVTLITPTPGFARILGIVSGPAPTNPPTLNQQVMISTHAPRSDAD
jgi:hypothetical protein